MDDEKMAIAIGAARINSSTNDDAGVA